jgi:hypothetical protein
MPIMVRLEQMRLIDRSRGIVNHRIVCHAVEDKARDASGLSRSEPDGLAVSPTP